MVQDFKDAEKALVDGIRNKKVDPKYAENNPEIYIYPLDNNGQIIREGEEKKQKILENNGTYYIPDDTGLDLLFQVNKNDQPKEFTFTIKNLVPVENPTLPKPRVDLNGLVFLNGKPVELTANKDGSYSFTTNGDKTFGIAQLKFNMPGFRAAFHEGFTLTLTGTGADDVTNTFLITKKGYEDYTNLNGPGLQKPGEEKPGEEDKIPEIDAGATEDNIVDQNTKELHDFFVELKKNNAYIDDVLVNSSNGKSLPLSSVDITITAPKNFNGNFADFIHQSGLNYHDNGDGTYTLKLNLEKFNKDEDFKVEDGKLTYKGEELKNKDFTNAILESTDGKKYIDGDKEEHNVTTTTVLEGKIDEVEYQVRLDKDHKVQSLWKKNADGSYEKLGDFKDGKVTADNTTYEVRGNDLISYTQENEVYEGNVSNDKEGKADPTVTPTFDGKQVRVTEKVDGEEKTSYGGTIVTDKIFQKVGDKDLKYLINQEGLKGKPVAWIDDNGKYYDQEAEGLRKVENKVFKDGYIVDGLEYRPGLTLIDKFGRPMRFITVEQVKVKKNDGTTSDEYKFTKKKGKTDPETVVTTKNAQGTCEKTFGGRTITVGQGNEIIFVDNTNYIVDDGHTDIIGNYYYDKEKDKFEEANKENVIGDKFYKDLKKTKKLTRKTIETYDEGQQIIPDGIDRYYGSLNPKDYYTIVEGTDERTYIKKGSKDNPYLESADGKKTNIIAGFEGQYVVQTLGDKQVITNEADIFDAVQNAKFAFRFPGFLAGKDIVYSAKADVIAKYRDPNQNNKEVSIFGDKESKTVTRYFTLKTNDITNPRFFKNKPEEFKENVPDYNFFNIFYRDSDDQKRDQLIKELFDKQDEVDTAKEKFEKAAEGDAKEKAKKAYEDLAKENKFYTDLLKTLQKELAERFDGAQFAVNKEGKVEIQDKEGNKIELDRSLLWEIGFESKKGDLLFPEDKDTSIVVEDYNMDNRLVYDEIIINDTKTNWKAAKDKWEADEKAKKDADANYEEKAFKGTDQYFFLDQIANIRFGVSRGYVDGDFIAVGPGFKITKDEILGALKNEDASKNIDDDDEEVGKYIYDAENDKHYIEKKGIQYEVKRDSTKGQIRIKVMNAFYKDNKDTTAEDYKEYLNNFYSPTQEAYEEQRKKFIDDANSTEEGRGFKVVEKPAEEGKSAAQATKEAFQESFENFIKETYDATTDCFGTLSHLFEERLKKVSTKKVDENGNTVEKTAAEIATELKKIRNDMVEAMKTMDLKYLDGEKNKAGYKFDDMRFNAIRLELKPNMVIGGAMTPQRTKKFGITSVIVPDVDIPYTDEFGKPLTNKDMYVNKEVRDILEKGITKEDKTVTKYKASDLKNEEKFIEIMTEAYKRVNAKITSKEIEIKYLVEFKDGKYTAKKGSDLGKDDLAIDGKPLENKKGGVVNPWYILTEKDGIKSLEDLAGSADEDTKKAIAKFKEKEIDLIGYYMLEQGYNRAFFKNFAQYKLPKKEQGPGIFGEDNNWKHKLCHPGIIGQCIENAGGDNKPGADGNKDKDEAGFKNDAEITIDYPSTDDTPDEEHPKVDKKSEKKDDVDISEKDKDGKEKDQKIDFTIDVSVNQMTKTDKDLYDIKQGKTPSTKPEDYENGHYKYKKDTLIMDILPNIFKLANGTKLNLTVNTEALMKGGVNAEIFKDKNAVDAWKKGIEYKYVEDLEAYLKTLTGDRKEVLQKAYDEALKAGRIKEGEKVQAVLAWLPEFVAPSGSENHFKFELKNVLVDKKEFKDYLDNGHGETYTNHAAFGDKGQVYFASTDVTIKKDKSGTVDKFLRIYDKDGKPVNEGNAKEWFEGNAELKFGDKFDYKLRYNNHIPTQETGKTGVMVSEFNIADQFAGLEKGLRPVLNGFVQVQEGYEGKYTIKYIINGTDYTKEQIEEQGLKLKDVTKITIETKTDRLGSGDHRDFILPMMIPNIDAKIDEKGNVYYVGEDGEKHELGEAKKFFNLKDLVKPGTDLSFDNKAGDSNTVTVYLEKERFIKVFKAFLAANGEKLKNLDNLEAKFDVYQIIEENGVKKRVKVGELKANKANDFTDMLDHLPIFKKTTTIDENGNVTVKEVKYEYELEEAAMPGFESKVYKLDDSDKLGFVWQATNTEKPEYPGDKPKKEHKEVTVTIRVNKTWEVLNGGSTPSIEVELYANGKATGKIFKLGDGNWSAVFENLPSKDDDGNEIIYTVVEVGSANGITMIEDRKFEVIYKTNADGSITILNKEVPNEEPKDKEEPKKDEPHDDEEEKDRDQGENKLPKTGVAEDLASIYFAFVLLLGLVFIKKRYLVK